MLRRKAIDSLSVWKGKEGKKPLIVEGARQVGKTFAIRAFSKTAYQSVYELNFLEQAGLRQIFEGDLDAETVLTGIIPAYVRPGLRGVSVGGWYRQGGH